MIDNVLLQKKSNYKKLNLRQKTLLYLVVSVVFLLIILIWGGFMDKNSYGVDFTVRNNPPSLKHIFGTDWMGRDMLTRTIKGLSTSLIIGVVASLVSCVFAVIIGSACAIFGKKIDKFFLWLIDLFQGMPHLILLVLISILTGKGTMGILVGVALTHWTTLSRIIRAEILSIKGEPYIVIAKKLGTSNVKIASKHILPHIIPQFIVGVVLLFPHAILHEAGITFLGFGLPPEEPAIGVILSESMRYITSGYWWLAFFPGLALMLMVFAFDAIGHNLEKIINPNTGQE
ncbi:ABC transporter permease [Fusobacterium polymorphum]|jgi:possible dipeptide/oligopeptide/nickel (ni2+) ABC superfamily ATP binding cassette transporter membrane protein|uniref:ABC transporter permease n=1 Tax=Fusobacterium nucleatum subsp. polymorphum TaxID=76857 RepID=UPI002B4BEA1D|nr:ABC transporter permease [Fusobacterium polymorphum]WRL70372.1 ABC transporter permease [Fusobacterium polymorphum]WRL78333.1 ABC transporter permease [Fusobacterium polymorphum]